MYRLLCPYGSTLRNKRSNTQLALQQITNHSLHPTPDTSNRLVGMADSQHVSAEHDPDKHVDLCCVRCAQLYRSYPDLRCYPNYREDEPKKGLTRQEEFSCKNCRVRKLKCRPVPQQYSAELATLQAAAKLVHDLRERQEIPVAAFYELKKAQHAFSEICPGYTRRDTTLRDRPGSADVGEDSGEQNQPTT